MIKKVSHVGIWVLDQDEALKFYTETLGLEVRTDVTMDNGFRWLTVGPKAQPDLEIILSVPGPPMVDDEAAAQIKALVAKGAMGMGVMTTEDCHATYKELSERGVTFIQEPAERPYGIEALFRDPFGNWFSLTQHWSGPPAQQRTR